MSISLNYIYGDGIEVFLDSLQTVGMTCSREIITYNSKTQKTGKSFARHVSPTNYRMEGKISTDDLEVRRKLEYLNTIDTNILMVLGSENDAMYGIIKNLTTERIKNGVSRVAVDVQASGRAISDIAYEAEDLTTDGMLQSDSNASGGEAVYISYGASVYKSIEQSNFALPLGDYKVFARVRYIDDYSTDVDLSLYNSTDSTTIGTTKINVSGDYYRLIESDTFTVASDDEGDSIQVKALCDVAYPAYIDFIGFARV